MHRYVREHADFIKLLYMGNYVIYFHHNREILLIFSYITMSHIHRIRAAIITNQNCHITVD